MKKAYYLFIFLLFSVLNGISQNTILCAVQNEYVKIENAANIPTVSYNEDGTVTLTHQDQNITDIFANYTIYDFYQAFPSSTGELFDYYTIVHGSKSLIVELHTYAHPEIFVLEAYNPTPISSAVIDLLDGKTYNLIKHCFESMESGAYCPEDEINVPYDFVLQVAFNYDEDNDIMYAETVGLSSCGNYINVGFKGGFDDGITPVENTLQLWESQEGISTVSDYDEPCHYIEDTLYSVLGIGCQEANYGNIKVNINSEFGRFVLERGNMIFAYNFLTFEDANLSVEEHSLELMRPFHLKGNPYLQISNAQNDGLTVEIYTLSGQKILNPTKFENNTIAISHFDTGVYFIKLSNFENQQKIFKFLKKN